MDRVGPRTTEILRRENPEEVLSVLDNEKLLESSFIHYPLLWLLYIRTKKEGKELEAYISNIKIVQI